LKQKKTLSFPALINGFHDAFASISDERRQASIKYSQLDTALSGLACMFYKSGDMISYQTHLKEENYKNNLETQFGVTDTPKDTQMREITATLPLSSFHNVFEDYLSRLQRGKQLLDFRFDEKYLVAIDATEYYSSDKINCPNCLSQTKRNGSVHYSHKALQPIICHPNKKQILPLMPEEIKNTDGSDKQDCEINAAYRLLPKIRAKHPKMNFIWLADSLYATAPFIQSILDCNEEFIFRVKKGDHKTLFKAVETADFESFKVATSANTLISHRIYRNIPLNGSTDIMVTAIQAFAITTNAEGEKKSTLMGAWATNIDVDKSNIAQVTKAARARWKVENECFNTLKNHGYDLAHNWGHVNGESFRFYLLIMLAFYMHQILEMTDKLLIWCKSLTNATKRFWAELALYFNVFLFNSWEELLSFYALKKNKPPPL